MLLEFLLQRTNALEMESIWLRCLLDRVITWLLVQDERNQILTAYLWIRQIWHDAYLTWDRDQYDGLDSIRIPSDLVWRPDIVLYNK